jgi:hypothetical protein
MLQKAVVVCPASLRDIWEAELREATVPAGVLSHEELGARRSIRLPGAMPTSF